MLDILAQAGRGKKPAMTEEGTVVVRAPASVSIPLAGGAELVRKPVDAQAFYYMVVLHGSLWEDTDLGSSSGSSTS